MKPYKILAITTCFICAIAFGISCKKTGGDDPKPEPVDSSTKQASRNCIDSVIGTYYGWTEAHNREYYEGKLTTNYNYNGADTVELIKFNDSTIAVSGQHLYGPSSQFVFDTSGEMDFYFSGASYQLHVNPYKDSADFTFRFSTGTVPYSGYDVFSRFKGKKK